MPVTLNHTIVPSHDKENAARFFARIMGLEYKGSMGHFAPVHIDGGVSLDWDNRDSFESHHYAFLITEEQFDEIFERIEAEGVTYGSQPNAQDNGEINTRRGGRGLYFRDPDGHSMEIMTGA